MRCTSYFHLPAYHEREVISSEQGVDLAGSACCVVLLRFVISAID